MNLVHLTYLFDPLCGWCYGALGVLQRLAAAPGFTIDLLPTGRFSGSGALQMDDRFAEHAWSNDQRIAQLTGQTFSESYRKNVLADRSRPFDSAQATLALTAVAVTAPARELDALGAIQRARFVDGRDITDAAVLSDVLRKLDLSAAAEVFATADASLLTANQRRVEAARAEMMRFGAQGVPTLIAGTGQQRAMVPRAELYDNADALIAKLQKSASTASKTPR